MARLPYVERHMLPPEQRPTFDFISQSRGGVHNVFRVLLNGPEAASGVARLGAYARFQTKLPPRLKELAVLTAAREAGCQYEWVQHQPMARQVGLGEEVIAAIRDRRAPQGLSPEDALPVRYALELLRDHRVKPETFQALHRQLGNEGMVELTVTIGYYTLLAMTLVAFEVELESGQAAQIPM
ncbi:MAG: carboxymuconolactone decarboxylase family protein [Chloroflexi bacterium]|nr:carboxymuconolactone decarboxylase family protein [Chloroflexota bacterium]